MNTALAMKHCWPHSIYKGKEHEKWLKMFHTIKKKKASNSTKILKVLRRKFIFINTVAPDWLGYIGGDSCNHRSAGSLKRALPQPPLTTREGERASPSFRTGECEPRSPLALFAGLTAVGTTIAPVLAAGYLSQKLLAVMFVNGGIVMLASGICRH